MLSLALEPTYIVGLNIDLKVPRSFKFVSKAPNKAFDYYKSKEDNDEKSKEITPVVLSTTKKARSRQEKIEP